MIENFNNKLEVQYNMKK